MSLPVGERGVAEVGPLGAEADGDGADGVGDEAERQLGIDDDGKAEVGWHLWLSVACDDRRLAARPGQFLPFFIESWRKMVEPTVLKSN